MKKKYLVILFYCVTLFINAQKEQNNTAKLEQLQLKLESIAVDTPGLMEKADINVNNIILPDFLRAIANTHKINLSISPELNNILISNNFSNATVSDILLFICKEYQLTLNFTGNIISIHKIKKNKKKLKTKTIPIEFNEDNNLFSIDLQQDTLYVAFKEITNRTGKNLVFAPGLENKLLSAYIKNMSFDSSLDKIAFSNALNVTKTKDNYYLFEQNLPKSINGVSNNRKSIPRNNSIHANFYYKVKDSVKQLVDVDFENTDISSIINDIGNELQVNMFTSSPLDGAGKTTVKATNISFDLLLTKILENTTYAYKKQNNIYFFGKKKNPSLQNSMVIPLIHRSIEIMSNQGNRQRNYRSTYNSYGNYNNTPSSTNYSTTGNNLNNRQQINTRNPSNFRQYNTKAEALVNILPDKIIKELDIKIDVELNSFIVSGPSQNIQKFKDFIKYIDKPIPVITIEVMILEVNKSATVETGVSWGLGDNSSQTKGNTFPTTDMTLGANTINKIISNNNGFGSLNIGKVLPNFYMNIKALEANGNIKVRSTPKLSTLNGHRSNLSIGETTYFVVTDRNFYGSQIPQTSEIKNYQPIEAQLGIDLKPLVSGDGQITMEINVIQSSFNGKRVDKDAPPGINSREFTSIVRVRDQELIILGGLEEKIKNDSGSGVPFLARIPIIKWLFSKRKREDSKKKLVVLIKPTVIY